MGKVTINEEQRLYVIPCQGGYTCLGFDVALDHCQRLAKWLREHGQKASAPSKDKLGTMEVYSRYQKLLSQGRKVCDEQGIRCEIELMQQLVGKEGKRVEVVDVHGEKRRFYVGKSTGWMPCHLEIARKDSTGGPAVMGTPFQSVRVV